MKKLFAWMLLLSLLAGCSLPISEFLPDQEISLFTESAAAPETEAPAVTVSQTPLIQSEPFLWARSQLEPAVQETYDLLSEAIACHQETEVEVSATAEQVQLVLTALSMDHPEYFWFDGQASYVSSTMPILGQRISVSFVYTMTREAAQAALADVEGYVSDCLSDPEVASAQTDYDRIIAVYRYIIRSTDYVLAQADQSFLSVMTKHQGTCAGYARCFQYLMHRLGIPCTLALGYGDSGESHGWNVVSCQGQWYHIDVTWGDPVDQSGAPGSSLEYTYCMLTDEEIYRTHIPEGEIPLPECTATEYNYFRQSGLQLDQWDAADYEDRMRRAQERGDQWFTVRFDRQEDYLAAMAELIDNSGIMTVLKNCGVGIPADGVTYSYNDISLEFSVKISY